MSEEQTIRVQGQVDTREFNGKLYLDIVGNDRPTEYVPGNCLLLNKKLRYMIIRRTWHEGKVRLEMVRDRRGRKQRRAHK